MCTRRLAGEFLAVVVLAAGPLAVAQDLVDRGAPGVRLSFYELAEGPRSLPELAPDQLPNVTRVAAVLDLDSERGDFAGVTSPFVTEATGYIHTTLPGRYGFQLISDDGAKLWVDGSLVIDHDGLHSAEPKEGAAELSAGTHEFRVSHFDAGGGQRLAALWKTPKAAEFVVIPAGVFTHGAGPALETAGGKKRIIPPLRRGRPGDGAPVAGMHPCFGSAPAGAAVEASAFREGEYCALARDQKSRVWVPDCKAAGGGKGMSLQHPTYESQVCIKADFGDSKRVMFEQVGSTLQGCVFRFAGADTAALVPVGKPDQSVFEMRAVRALANGFEIEFTKALDARCGWEADSYYVEQWPFNMEEGRSPKRDGSTVTVKSASVSADRKQVFLETEGIKPAHVVYIRLLAPCFAEGGELPWSTEAWYTLNAIPQDRTGQALPAPAEPARNVLTDAERQAGWKLLFDGRSGAGWHGWKKQEFPTGWQAVNGCLVRVAPAGDIATDEEFENFELALEWRISAGGNSGIFFHSDENLRWAWEAGPEMQVLDNSEHADGRNPLTSAGSNYALHAPTRDVTRPVGVFNEVRIVVKGPHVEHWLNGEKIVEYELGSPEWQATVAGSKFKDMPNYGRVAKGHIVLQDHGDKVWYRNIKIRPLP